MSLEPPAAAGPLPRLPLIDAARGAAILAMIVYHFSWDLHFFGFIASDVAGEPGWRIFARLIAGTFLFLVGVSLVLAARSGFDRPRFLRRLAVIAASAAAVSAVTWFAMPDAFVFFGILHAIAVSTVLGLAFLSAPIVVVAAASLFAFLAPALLSGPFFDAPALWWLGLTTVPPRSNDYVPIFPWFGVVLAGIAVTRLALLLQARGRPVIAPLARPAPWPLIWAGRHSLAIYLIHQPVLFGVVYLAAQIAPPDMLGFEDSFLQTCTVSCAESDVEAGICRSTCLCLVERTQAEGLWSGLMREELSEPELDRYWAIVGECREAAETR